MGELLRTSNRRSLGGGHVNSHSRDTNSHNEDIETQNESAECVSDSIVCECIALVGVRVHSVYVFDTLGGR